MKLQKHYLLPLLLLSMSVSAHNFQQDQRVAPVGISDRGELNYQNNEFSYKNWNSAQLGGKVRVIQHIAGRTSAKDMNDPLIEAIKKAVMRGSSAPTGTMVAPQVHGYTKELAQRLPYSQDRAKELLKEAGYDNSLTFTLDCPNDRYINDEAICQAIVGMWAKVGVKANLNAMPRATYFPKVQSFDSSAYMFGWGVPTFDALYTLQSLMHSKGEGADGSFNFGGYENAEVDALIDQIIYKWTGADGVDPNSRGGSASVHRDLKPGDRIEIQGPRNHFPLAEDAPHSVLIAGGIGITPVHAMVHRLSELGRG